ncbi:DUF3368 domain-containing protein [Rubrivirga sp. S365]|uniref:DUF3368 domain-containing protein n=1 Tax=Rubrivirga litoralis TaxID=3075598 RepID=A0ABU3BLV0_9BACT|nr:MULTISPECIES: DUF3368 domain-containing protein [unclassified Rubrivirga]MDT0630238.1 DUF3368 domain-containing protein [Rubrivirga sp. F394]MDT7855749.1 DUF3368 domain-containing protein [Rubrivirga sp. S365]
MDLVVTDTTPLIALDRVGHLYLLPALFDVVAPPTVVSEFGRRPPWLRERPVPDPSRVTALLETLDRGEAEAIALAESLPNARLLIDERKGRRVATSLNLRVTGTAGVLLAAKGANLVPHVRPLFDALVDDRGLHLSTALRLATLREAGEA